MKRNTLEEILTTGVDEIINKKHMEERLKRGEKLRIKYGIDPTSPDLHLGHSVVFRKLRQFQELGHKVIFLIGDFTATIGDPSGRTEARKLLTKQQIKKNMKDYVSQAAKVLDMKKVEIRYNSEWYEKRGIQFLLQLTSLFTYARVIERDDFKRRIKEDIDVSVLELLYPLLQGYDSVELKADAEIGGRDQKFNLLMGRKVQKKYGQKQQDIIMIPLLEGTDGVRKMSKSYGNYIAINDSPKEMYGKLMSIPDELIWKYLVLLTAISKKEIEELKEQKQRSLVSPIDIKIRLAKEVVSFYHGKEKAQKAEKEFKRVFVNKEVPSDISEKFIGEIDIPITKLLVITDTASSLSEARRLVEQKGIKIDNKVKEDWKEVISTKKGMIIQRGKKTFRKIK